MASIQHRKMENIQYLYHTTNNGSVRNIFADGMMLPRKTETPYWTKLARDANSPMGVWFCASLLESELPVTSTYGENRIKIPCQHVISNMHKPRLFLESFYYFESKPKNQIARLILVDAEKQPKEHDWCAKECLRRLNMADNKILVLNNDKHMYKCIANTDEVPHIWVEVLVVGHVTTVAIDTVEEIPPSKQDATPGKVPSLI